MKFNKVVTFLSFAWLPVAVMLVLGTEANAMTGVDSKYVSDAQAAHSVVNTALAHRFSPTRYGYPSDLLGKEVPLVYGASQGRASFPERDLKNGLHELIITAHEQGDLDRDGRHEAIVLVEESLCSERRARRVATWISGQVKVEISFEKAEFRYPQKWR